MGTTVYEELRDEFFKLKHRKEQLNKEIEKLTSARQQIEFAMDEIDFILSNHGTHVPDNYIEDKGE